MLKNYFRFAWRNLWKNRGVNWINIAGLSAGMTSAILIFLWVQNETSFDSYHPQASRIYRATSKITTAKWVWPISPLPLAKALKEQIPEVENTARAKPASIFFHIQDEFFPEKNGAYVDKSWFDLFHYDFTEGSPASFFQQPFSLALTESKARKYFGSREAIGQVIRIDTVNYRVQAVIKDNPANSSFQFEVLMPIDALLSNPDRRKNDDNWHNFNYLTFLKLRPAASPAKIAAKMTAIVTENKKAIDVEMDLMPLQDMHFETGLTSSGSSIEHADRKTVYIFAVLGIFLLIIACINYVNLATARASLRAKEVSIRKIAGAGKGSLFIQFIFESLIVSGLSLLITLLLLRLTLPFYNELTGKTFENPLLSPNTWKILGYTLLAATILNGVYPAILLSSFRPLNVFKGVSVLRIKDVSFRKALVVLQFTFSVVLIISTIVIQRQLNYIQKTNPGYDRSQVFSFNLPWTLFKGKTEEQTATLFSDIKHELLSQTSVAGATAASSTIVQLGSTNSGSADWDGHDTTYQPTVYQLSADEDYQKTLRIELQQGRWFLPDNPADRHNFILNETAVNEFNIHKPVLGQRFIYQNDTGKIIGVAKDFHFASLHEKIAPMVMFNKAGWRYSVFVRTQPGKIPQALAAAKTIARRYNPDKPFDYSFMDEEFEKLYQADTKLSTLILLFSGIAILISSLGLFGLAAFTAEQRTKEIGIRKVLGATVTNIVSLLSRDFILLVALAILIATPVAGLAMHRWLQDFAYHIPVTASIFILAGIIAVLIALATISFQAIRAAIANPVKSLRTE